MGAPFAPPAGPPDPPAPPSAVETADVGRELRAVMAVFSVVAAAIHFGFAPAHFAEAWYFGTFFLVAAWFQLGWAALVVRRAPWGLLAVGVLFNAGVVAVWAVSRTSGLPFGPGSGTAEAVGGPDVVSTILESLIIVGCAVLLYRPELAERPLPSVRTAAAVTSGLAVAALIAGSISITPQFAGAHEHGAGGEHGAEHAVEHGATEGITDADSVVGGMGDMDHGAGGEHDHSAGGSTDGATAAGADGAASGTAASSTSTEHAHTTGMPFNGDSPCEEQVGTEDPEGSKTEGHNHHGALPQKPLTEAERTKLVAQQEEARAVVARYPTVADAEKAGYRLSTTYLPCIGAHYTNISKVGSFDPANPSELLYDGTTPDAKIIGLSYLIVHDGPPEGFAGPNDVWHQHASNGGLCLNKAGVVIGGERISEATCKARGGYKAGLENIWMVHDWVAPGWECSWGVFAAECPELGGKAGKTVFAE